MTTVAKTEREKLEGILAQLTAVGDVIGTAVVSRDGLLIADALPKDVDAAIFSSMTATMHGAGETAIAELNKGACDTVLAESGEAKVLSQGVDPTFLVVAMTDANANLGLIRIELGKAADEIRTMLGTKAKEATA